MLEKPEAVKHWWTRWRSRDSWPQSNDSNPEKGCRPKTYEQYVVAAVTNQQVDDERRFLITFPKPERQASEKENEKVCLGQQTIEQIKYSRLTQRPRVGPHSIFFNTSYCLTRNTLPKRDTPAAVVEIFLRCDTFITKVHGWIYMAGNHPCRAIGDLRRNRKMRGWVPFDIRLPSIRHTTTHRTVVIH